jgi:hypothetical protein
MNAVPYMPVLQKSNMELKKNGKTEIYENLQALR